MQDEFRNPRILESGDTALVVEFGDRIDPEINRRVIAMDASLRDLGVSGVIETVPTYKSLLVILDPLVADRETLGRTLRDMARDLKIETGARRRWQVPVVYGGDCGIDLEYVAGLHGMSAADLVKLHGSVPYTVYLIGFMPGFSYLGGLPEALATPRRPVPRPTVPAGSISIGGAQCAVGSVSAPSGWHLIGQTPVRAYMQTRDPIFLFQPGDEIVFSPISNGDWCTMYRAAEAGEAVAVREDQ